MWLASVIDTITSLVFSRLVLVPNSAHLYPLFRKYDGRDTWKPVDRALLRLSQRTEAKVIVKGRTLHEAFRTKMENAFPLTISAEALEFELNDSLPCTCCPVKFR